MVFRLVQQPIPSLNKHPKSFDPRARGNCSYLCLELVFRTLGFGHCFSVQLLYMVTSALGLMDYMPEFFGSFG